jgi:hypothetical protein
MQYLLMIYANEAAMVGVKPADMEAMSEAYAVFTRDIVQSGAFKGGERLHPSTSATTVRVRNGKPLLTDGPFAETREQLVGYYVVEAANLDAATAIAARIPGASTGTIEVRPIAEMQQQELQKFGRAS